MNRKIAKKHHLYNTTFHIYTNYFYLHFQKGKKTFITIELTNLDLEFIVDEWDRVFGV